MKRLHPSILCGMLVLAAAPALRADSGRQTKLTIAAGGAVNIVNTCGSVTLHQSGQRQVTVNATTHSDKVEVDARSTPDGKRVEVRTYTVTGQKPSSDESRVDYDITVPSGVSVSISTATAPITLDKVSGDLFLSSDTGSMTVRNAANSYIHIRGVAAPIVLSNITGHVEITSSGGPVALTGVSGSRVMVGTASGNITYQGDFSGSGSYSLTTHSGAIDVSLPVTASVDLTARSMSGAVENDSPLRPKPREAAHPSERYFAGTSNSGSSSVELQSFSGKIRIKKQ
jgi:DUF4097 and DUF4098 domain-containing protein YvlB